MGVCSVMVLRLVLHGATTKPGASCGARHKVVLLGTHRYQGLLVMIHYGDTPMCYLLVNLFLDVVPYLVRRSVPQIKIFSSSEIGIWIVGYILFIMLIYFISNLPASSMLTGFTYLQMSRQLRSSSRSRGNKEPPSSPPQPTSAELLQMLAESQRALDESVRNHVH
jgi:hypothetical protein